MVLVLSVLSVVPLVELALQQRARREREARERQQVTSPGTVVLLPGVVPSAELLSL